MMKQLPLLTGQTLYDLAIQEYGHSDGIYLIIEDNPDVVSDLSDVPAPGTLINIRLEVPELSDNNRAIAAEFSRRNEKVVSGAAATVIDDSEDGYWDEDYSDEDYV